MDKFVRAKKPSYSIEDIARIVDMTPGSACSVMSREDVSIYDFEKVVEFILNHIDPARLQGRYGVRDVAKLIGMSPSSTRARMGQAGVSIRDFPAVVQFIQENKR